MAAMTAATIEQWKRNMVARGEAYHTGLSNGREAASASRPQDSCDPSGVVAEAFAENYRTGWMHGYLRTERARQRKERDSTL